MAGMMEFVILIYDPDFEICRFELWSDGEGNTRVETFIHPQEERAEMGALLLVAAHPQLHPYFKAKILSMLAMMEADLNNHAGADLN